MRRLNLNVQDSHGETIELIKDEAQGSLNDAFAIMVEVFNNAVKGGGRNAWDAIARMELRRNPKANDRYIRAAIMAKTGKGANPKCFAEVAAQIRKEYNII